MVYLVDDDIDDLELVQDALAMNSYEGPVSTILNGKALIDKLTEKENIRKPDVILLDLNMPLKDGFETLQEIRGNPDLKNIPVIVLTASSKKEDEIRCFELGCNFYYTKPNTMHDYKSLVAMVKKLVHKAS
jgi:CheY-like chemotaxis protein